MFCPTCKNLCFPDLYGNVQCVTNRCNYVGPAQTIIMIAGEEVDVSKIATGWSKNGPRICRTPGCYSPVHSHLDYCHNCPGNSGMMPGEYYRAWAY